MDFSRINNCKNFNTVLSRMKIKIDSLLASIGRQQPYTSIVYIATATIVLLESMEKWQTIFYIFKAKVYSWKSAVSCLLRKYAQSILYIFFVRYIICSSFSGRTYSHDRNNAVVMSELCSPFDRLFYYIIYIRVYRYKPTTTIIFQLVRLSLQLRIVYRRQKLISSRRRYPNNSFVVNPTNHEFVPS